MNAAYDKGRACTYYVLTINACALEDSLDRHEPMIWIQMDYKSFFDRLVREIAFACMKGYGILERAVFFYEELYTKMAMRIQPHRSRQRPLTGMGAEE